MTYGEGRNKTGTPITYAAMERAYKEMCTGPAEYGPDIATFGYTTLVGLVRKFGAHWLQSSNMQIITDVRGYSFASWVLRMPAEYVDYVVDRGVE